MRMRREGRHSKRLSLVLAILVLGHEFNPVLANTAQQMKEEIQGTEHSYNDDNEDSSVKYYKEHQGQKLQDNNHKYDSNESKALEKPGKRGIHGALFAASIGVSLLHLALDIILKVKGCCFFYRSICRNSKEYNRRAKALDRQMKQINAKWKYVKNLRKWIQQSNNRNAQIWIEVKRVGDLQDKIIKLLRPDIIKEYNIKETKFREMVQKGNQSVISMSYKEFDKIFQKSFSSVQDTALRLTGVTGLIGVGVIAKAFKHYKLAKIQKVLRTSYGSKLLKAGPKAKKLFGFSKASMKLHLKQTSKSMYKARFAGTRMAKFVKFGGSVMSIVSIAMDVYSIIKKIRACKKIRNNARKGVRDVKRAQASASKMNHDLNVYYNQLYHRGEVFVRKQMTSNDLRAVLINIRDMANAASIKARDVRSAPPVINRFLAQIKGAKHPHVTSLQKQLIAALKKVTVYLTCYYNKLRMVTYVTTYCEKGHDQVEVLYNTANRLFNSNSQFCKTKNGFSYTTLDSVKRLIRSRSKKKWFNFDCVLNSKTKKDRACRMKWKGYSIKKIASKLRVLEHHIKHYFISCGIKPITPRMQSQTCNLRRSCISENLISSVLSITQKRLLSVKCPCSELSS